MRVVVSGSSSGIGRATAEKFLEKGHEVTGIDLALPTIVDRHYTHVIHDIRNGSYELDVEPEIVVCSAGTLEERDAIAVNLEGTISFCEYFKQSPNLRSVVIIASASARNGAEFPRYVASKAGIVGYMKNLALELAPRGVTCNAISPGGVITPANDHILNDRRLYAAVLAETLLHKWAEAREIADFAYFLSVTNRSMTGEDLLVDNGEMLKSNFIW